MGLNLSNRQIAAELEMSETQSHERTTTLLTGIVPQEGSIELSSTVECDEVYVIAGHMVPMISSVEEVNEMIAWVGEAKSQLSERGIEHADQVPLGIMVETPASVLLIEELLMRIDFCSIGTNDLTQYILAVDRGNEKVAALYDPFHPAVFRAIEQTVLAAKKQRKSVSLCGELEGDLLAAPFLIGIGLTQLSMTPSRIPALKQCVRQLDVLHSRLDVSDRKFGG